MLIRENEVYSQPDGIPLHYDLFRPEMPDETPLVVGIHGGGWISGSKDDYHDIARVISAAGYAVALINYRLAPLHPFPAAVKDVQSFIAHARANAKEWRVDPRRIATLGNSAGGHLAAMAALTGEERANAAVAICPITDVTDPRDKHLPISWSFLEEFLAVPYEGHEDVYKEASPIFHVTVEAPPFLIVHGEADDIVPVEQSDVLAKALQDAGASVDYHRLPNESHGFSYQGWNHITQLFLRFLENNFSHALR